MKLYMPIDTIKRDFYHKLFVMSQNLIILHSEYFSIKLRIHC